MCPEELFEGKNFQKISFFSISLWTCADDFQDSSEKCRKHHQSFIPLVQTNILPKKCFGENEFNTCGFSGKKSQNFVGKLWRRNFWGNKFCKKCNSNQFLTLGEEVSNFSPKVPSRAVRKAFYVIRGWILGKKLLEVYSSLFFSDTVQNFLDFMRRIFCRIINYAFYSPKGSFWEKLVFEICASHSRISCDNRCGFFAQNFPVGLSNLNPKFVLIILFKKKFCWNIYHFLYFWTVSSNFSDFWQKNNDWVAESALYSFRDF